VETCTEPADGGGRPRSDWTLRFEEWVESVDSEWSAAREAFAGPGTEPIRKWLGWALYRLAARLNPEIDD
jgi:hypothetical protein